MTKAITTIDPEYLLQRGAELQQRCNRYLDGAKDRVLYFTGAANFHCLGHLYHILGTAWLPLDDIGDLEAATDAVMAAVFEDFRQYVANAQQVAWRRTAEVVWNHNRAKPAIKASLRLAVWGGAA